ncbi:MAG: sensor histidine kinase, partial [Pseudonocardiaceae bacterium]
SLHSKLAEREEALERFAEQIVLLQETERRRLAGEIHDGISQRIVSLSFHLSAAADALASDPCAAAEQIARAQDLAGAALDETRHAIAGLRPPVLDDLGLAASLESLARSTPLPHVQVDTVSTDLPEHAETAVYRIAQEALQNVMKHACAQHVHLRLSATAEAVLLEVSDDGSGFDPAAESEHAGPGGYGLPGMQQRAELLGGQLTTESTPGRGTTVRLRVPSRTTANPSPEGVGG